MGEKGKREEEVRHLGEVDPIKDIYVVGRSNVGKSSVIRALTGKKVRLGRRPGVTTGWKWVEDGELRYLDMPGFGFMEGASHRRAEETKNRIVHELEEKAELLDLALLVLDSKAFLQIAERWEARGEIPIDVEMHDFLKELGIPLLVVANKIDKLEDVDRTLDSLGEKLGYLPPWRQWMDVLVPVSSKRGTGIPRLRRAIFVKLGLA